ncbi:MAG: protein kinase, partial [Gemmatimonadetes bacterium]|nr:protein kinase [Gemmatimonadota bacterium]NIR75966.1 protein kinase [Candidatus Kutchimonas denitrificans]NIS02123.1 protein kinase [Gemmatimonadota bacterium]NIT67948.1 protein kinase [Gemmatimonadota bacterium]NIU53942.1 protein kinase [Gemmatimonadota bacterium]
RIAREVASALDYAHRNNVVHRDVKPENILLHEGSALVADFGIGKALSEAESEITQTGMMLGTPTYMSPEQASGEEEIDGRSDLYSLGCVLYEMLAGEPPFTGPNAQAIITKRFVSPIPHVRAVRDVPDAVDDVTTRALARTPVDRFPSAADFAEVLKQIQAGGQTPPGGTPKRAPPKQSIAVLPLANLSADPENEYFSDGMTEEIINALAKLPGVQVASRTSCFSFKGKEVDVRQVGEKLGVANVLEGSVRKIGNRIRLTVQLVDVANGYQLWSETYDRQLEDVFAIQDEISRAIVDALKVRLVGDSEKLVVPTTENIEAYTLYLKGRYFFNKSWAESELRKSMDFFEQALEKDPTYARAYAGIADCWAALADEFLAPEEAYTRAKTAATRALELEPTLVEALTSVGKVLCWYEWDFDAAARELHRAVTINPNSADAHFVLGSALPTVGQLDDAIEEMRKALVLDPLAPHHSRWLGRFLLYAGDYARSIEQNKKTLEINANYSKSYLDIGSAYLGLDQPEKALESYRRGQSLESSVRSYDALIVQALAAMGEEEEARAILDRLEEDANQQYMRAEILAMGYAALGEIDRAFERLEEAFEARSAGLIYLHLDPGYEPLRSDPRFAPLVERIGIR